MEEDAVGRRLGRAIASLQLQLLSGAVPLQWQVEGGVPHAISQRGAFSLGCSTEIDIYTYNISYKDCVCITSDCMDRRSAVVHFVLRVALKNISEYKFCDF